MKAGRLRHTVTVERQTDDIDNYGARQDVWNALFSTRASVEPINGREYMTQSGEHSDVTTRIRMRYSDSVGGIQPRDRIAHGLVVYDVLSVINPMEKGREMVLMCKRWGGDG